LNVGPTVNEKKTNDDDEIVVLENKSTAHNLNETSRSSRNVETSEFDFMKRGEQGTITHGKRFQMICQKVNNMINPAKTFSLSFILGDFLEMIKRRFQTSFFLNIGILNHLGPKEDAPVHFCCELPFLLNKEALLFFSCLKRLKKLYAMGHERLSSFALISIECDLSHPESVDIENFI